VAAGNGSTRRYDPTVMISSSPCRASSSSLAEASGNGIVSV